MMHALMHTAEGTGLPSSVLTMHVLLRKPALSNVCYIRVHVRIYA